MAMLYCWLIELLGEWGKGGASWFTCSYFSLSLKQSPLQVADRSLPLPFPSCLLWKLDDSSRVVQSLSSRWHERGNAANPKRFLSRGKLPIGHIHPPKGENMLSSVDTFSDRFARRPIDSTGQGEMLDCPSSKPARPVCSHEGRSSFFHSPDHTARSGRLYGLRRN